ncbi:MAG: Mor transcription activator family protein [Pseudomonadota bacterium]
MNSHPKPDLAEIEELVQPIVREFITLLGYQDTEKLIQKFGGITFRVRKGKRLKDNRRREILVEHLGEEVTKKLEGYFGGEDVYIPRNMHALREYRNQHFLNDYYALIEKGESARFALLKLCPIYGVSDRWAQNLVAKQNLSSQQLDLL